MMSTIVERIKSRKAKPAPIAMANGKPARFRLIQTVIWSAVVGACAAAFVAGLYFNITQVRWGSVDLKPAWDGLFSSPSWEYFRHGYRDQGEPLLAFLIVGTVFAKRKHWTRQISAKKKAAAPLLLILGAFAWITLGVWFLYFVLPGLPGIGSPPNHYLLLAGTVLVGFLGGKLIRPLWTPVGASINGWLIDRSVDKHERRRAQNLAPGLVPTEVPFWVRHWYTAPLPTRERWVWMREHNEEITARRDLPGWVRIPLRGLTVLAGLLVAYLVVTGFIAHFYIGTGHDVPFLAPAGS
jgi:hypothetical protein